MYKKSILRTTVPRPDNTPIISNERQVNEMNTKLMKIVLGAFRLGGKGSTTLLASRQNGLTLCREDRSTPGRKWDATAMVED